MNNHDSIRYFIILNLCIIIACFSIISYANICYAIKIHSINLRLIFEIFIIIVIIDYMHDFCSNEKNLFFERYYCYKRYITVRKIELYKKV